MMQSKRIASILMILVCIWLLTGCGTRQDELASMQAEIDTLKTQVANLAEQLEKTPEPSPNPEPASEQKNEWSFEKGDYSARLRVDAGKWVAELTDPSLLDSYTVNQQDVNIMEYCWMVCFTANGNNYQVGTSYCMFEKASPTECSILDMQADLWSVSGDSMSYEGSVLAARSGTTISWTFELPGDIDPSTVEITDIEIASNGMFY